MRHKFLIVYILILSLMLTGCGKTEESPIAKSGFSASVQTEGFPESRTESEGFDHASFDAAIITELLGAKPQTDPNARPTVDTDNHVIAPANLYYTLASLVHITGGTTRHQLLKLLGNTKISEVENNGPSLWTNQFYRTSNAAALMGHSLWISNSISIPESSLQRLAEESKTASYVGRPSSDNFSQSYRDWLGAMSGGLLNDSLSEVSLDKSMTIASASSLYYKALFSQSFVTASTHQGTFYTPVTEVTAYMMHMDQTFPYHEDVTFQAAGIPLMNGATLWLLQPAENTTPAALAADPAVLSWLNDPGWDESFLSLTFPRFDIINNHDLMPALQSLGVTEIFDPARADFSSLSGDIKGVGLSHISQLLRMRVFEGGIEATAFSEAAPEDTKLPENTVQMRLNRPFMFALRDYDGTLIYVGIVNDPTR